MMSLVWLHDVPINYPVREVDG